VGEIVIEKAHDGIIEGGDNLIFLPEDREICEAILQSAHEGGDHAGSIPKLIVRIGFRLLGAPYQAETLEREGMEELVINLRAFDCVTFVENVVVLAGLIRAGKIAFQDYAAALERIRYRDGRRNGYPSRLHYFTDWLRNNDRKGVVRDITAEIGGHPFRKPFHTLTDRRGEHPALEDPAAFRRMRIVEAACSRRTFHYIPKIDVQGMEGRIEDGDIVAITTDADGIDVGHVGIAVRVRRGLRLLHASSQAGKVVLSDATLCRYLRVKRSRTGIIVGRMIRKPVVGRRLVKENK
jgi:hypothetical protein